MMENDGISRLSPRAHSLSTQVQSFQAQMIFSCWLLLLLCPMRPPSSLCMLIFGVCVVTVSSDGGRMKYHLASCEKRARGLTGGATKVGKVQRLVELNMTNGVGGACVFCFTCGNLKGERDWKRRESQQRTDSLICKRELFGRGMFNNFPANLRRHVSNYTRTQMNMEESHERKFTVVSVISVVVSNPRQKIHLPPSFPLRFFLELERSDRLCWARWKRD